VVHCRRRSPRCQTLRMNAVPRGGASSPGSA
jgi:hypothetical protein